MRYSSPEHKNLKAISGLLVVFFGFNLFVAVALAAANVEWSPSSGLTVADKTASYTLGLQEKVQMVRSDDGATEYYISYWLDADTSEICAQKFDAAGAKQWPDVRCPKQIYDGSNGIGARFFAVSDGDGGLIAAWDDGTSIYMNRVDGTSSNSSLWSSSGILMGSGAGFGATLEGAVSDGNNGITVIYKGAPSNTCLSCRKVFVLRVDDSASVLWEESPVYTATSDITANITSVADYSDSDSLPDYIIQFTYSPFGVATMRLDSADGNIPSPWDTFLLDNNGGYTSYYQAVTDTYGGAYYISHDSAGGLYLSHVDKDGNENPNFPSNQPVEVTNVASTLLEDAHIINDGSDGVFIVYSLWNAAAPSYPDDESQVYAAHLDASGDHDSGWGSGPVTVSEFTNSTKVHPYAALNGNDEIYVIWQDDTGNSPDQIYDIYGQLISGSNGATSFGSDVQLTNLASSDTFTDATSISGESNPVPQVAAVTDADTLLTVWNDESDVEDVYIQLFDGSDGSVDLTSSGLAVSGQTDNAILQGLQKIEATSDNSYIVTWLQVNPDGSTDIYGEKFDSTGAPLWNSANPGDGVQLTTHPNDGSLDYNIAADDNGGAFIVWSAMHDDATQGELFGQHIGSDGSLLWDTGSDPEGYGVLITPLSEADTVNYTEPELLFDGTDSIFVSYKSESAGNAYVGAIHLDGSTGNIDSGWNLGSTFQIDTIDNDDETRHMVLDGSGGIIIGYVDTGLGVILKAARVDSSGAFPITWPMPVSLGTMCNFGCDTEFGIVADGNNGAILTFHSDMDIYFTTFEILAQRLNSSGAPQWTDSTPLGVDITDVTGDQLNPHIVSDNVAGGNGAVIAWTDFREGLSDSEVYAQRINYAGVVAWDENGVNVSNSVSGAGVASTLNDVVSNGSHGILLAYQSDESVYAQHLNGYGVAQWSDTVGGVEADNGHPVDRNDADAFSRATIAGDGNAGAVIAWAGNDTTETFGYDVFAQYISDSNGAGCSDVSSNGFCATQVIDDAILSFSSIPSSFIFPTVTSSGSAQNVFNNNDNLLQPDDDDLLGVLDTRNSGGFTVQLQESTTFTNGTPSEDIPLSNLFAVTSVSSPVYSIPGTDAATSCPGTDCGVIYETTVTERGITAPLDSNGDDLAAAGTYTSYFGSGALVLMDAELPETSGRDGSMYQFVNYRLQVPALQPPGNFAVIITFDLFDNTTP